MRIRSTKPEFWRSLLDTTTAQACAAEVIFDGPLPVGPRRYVGLAPMRDATEYLYLLFADDSELLYVGRSFRPADRFSKHCRKPWWPRAAWLVLVRVVGEDWTDAGAMIDRLERMAIRNLKPTHNIALVVR